MTRTTVTVPSSAEFSRQLRPSRSGGRRVGWEANRFGFVLTAGPSVMRPVGGQHRSLQGDSFLQGLFVERHQHVTHADSGPFGR